VKSIRKNHKENSPPPKPKQPPPISKIETFVEMGLPPPKIDNEINENKIISIHQKKSHKEGEEGEINEAQNGEIDHQKKQNQENQKPGKGPRKKTNKMLIVKKKDDDMDTEKIFMESPPNKSPRRRYTTPSPNRSSDLKDQGNHDSNNHINGDGHHKDEMVHRKFSVQPLNQHIEKKDKVLRKFSIQPVKQDSLSSLTNFIDINDSSEIISSDVPHYVHNLEIDNLNFENIDIDSLNSSNEYNNLVAILLKDKLSKYALECKLEQGRIDLDD
jgi:hypothetical protein